jgi:tetratricopeptide (TPR) repeat protein
LEVMGRFDEALESYEEVLSRTEAMADADPKNTVWLGHLSAIHGEIGSVLQSQGKLDEALANFRIGLELAERLAATDPNNALWQHDLSLLHDRVGFVLAVQGHFDVALTRFFAGMQARPNATEQERFSEALLNFRSSVAIKQHFVRADATNKTWQVELARSYGLIGSLLIAQDKSAEATDSYQKALEVWKELVAHDPSNIGWQADLGSSLNDFAFMLEKQGKITEVLPLLKESNEIAQRVADADRTDVQAQVSALASNLHLLSYDRDPIPRLEWILSELRSLEQQNKLMPAQVPYLEAIEEVLAKLRSGDSSGIEEVYARLQSRRQTH